MKISEIKRLLDADALCCETNLETDVESAFCCDMMSDVLAFATNHSVLITGLLNPQVVRTAMMLDMGCIVFVCGKYPTPEIVSLARENGIIILVTGHYMFAAAGLLYQTGNLTGV